MLTCKRVVQGQLCVPKHGGVAQLNADCQWSVCSLHAHPFPGTPVFVDATCFQRIQSEQMTTMFPNKLNVVFECNDLYDRGTILYCFNKLLYQVSVEFNFVILVLVPYNTILKYFMLNCLFKVCIKFFTTREHE